MLYILRPLIYALLVQQIDAHRARTSASTTTSTGTTDSSNNNTGTVATGGISAVVASTNTTTTSASVISRVLDVFSMDALLNVLALVVSFVSDYFLLLTLHRTFGLFV